MALKQVAEFNGYRWPTFSLKYKSRYDCGIKYEWQEDITHLLDALKTIDKISEDWDLKL